MSRLDTAVWMAKQAGKGAKRAARQAASVGEPVAAGDDLMAALGKAEVVTQDPGATGWRAAAPAPAATPAATPAVTPAVPAPAAAPAAAVGDITGSAALAKATPTTTAAPSSLGQRFANALRAPSKPAANINPEPLAAKLQQALTSAPTTAPGVFQRGYSAVKPLLSRGAELATKGGQALASGRSMVKGNPKASIAAALATAVASLGAGKALAGGESAPQNFGAHPKAAPYVAAVQARGTEAAANPTPEWWAKLPNPMKALVLLTGGGLAAGGGMMAYKAMQRRRRAPRPQVEEEV